MSLGVILTIILLVIKVTHSADPSWLQVFLPLIIETVVDVLLWIVIVHVARRSMLR